MNNETRQFLRHIVATVAYRGGKAIRDAPDNFPQFRIGETTKTPLEILSHIGDLYDWSLSQAKGDEKWSDSGTIPWNKEVDRFFKAVESLDRFLASDNIVQVPVNRLFQGPIADSLTHVGQLAMLRRLAGSPIRGENFFEAEIVSGRTGEEQSEPVKEFD